MSGFEKYLTTWAKTIQLYIVNLFYTILSENDIHWRLLWFYWKILQQIEALSQCPKCNFHQKWGYIILLFLHFSLYLPTLLHAFFALFMFVTIYVDYAKHIDTSCHFLEINYSGYNLNFLKLKLLIDGGTQVQNLHKIIVNLQFGTQRKSKHSREQQKSVTLLGAMLMLLVIQLYRIVFSIEFNHSS